MLHRAIHMQQPSKLLLLKKVNAVRFCALRSLVYYLDSYDVPSLMLRSVFFFFTFPPTAKDTEWKLSGPENSTARYTKTGGRYGMYN